MDYNHVSNPTIFWLAIVAVVFIAGLFQYLERSSRYRAIERMAEKGQTVPPEMFSRLPRDRYSWRNSHPVASGIFLMCIGVALAVFLWAVQGGGNPFFDGHANNWLPVVGIFPFMTGLARVLAAAFERRPPESGS